MSSGAGGGYHSKDDISMTQGQQRERVKANPYATIKMWRPVAMATSSSLDEDPDAEVYQSFSNFDALRLTPGANVGRGSDWGRLPATGHVTEVTARSHDPARVNGSSVYAPPNQGRAHQSRQLIDSPFTVGRQASSKQHQQQQRPVSVSAQNGTFELPIDYPSDSPPPPSGPRKVSFKDVPETVVANGKSGRGSSSASSSSSSRPPTRPPPPPPLPSSPPPSLPTSPRTNLSTTTTTTAASTTPRSNNSNNKSSSSNPPPPPPPPPLPSTSHPISSSSSAPSPSPSPSSSSQHDTSFQVVSDGATNSIRLVLSHSYASPEPAARDIERLLAELKLTMDSLRTSRIDKNPAQRHMCQSELRAETHQFIQEAKVVVSSANNSREKMLAKMETAVHTLARLFLHGQATMLMLDSNHQAQHLGMQLVKASNAFKTTVGAANAAAGKPLNDPHMKYLMRQATNLASLLAALLNTIREIQGQ
ncbi:formin-like protein 5 [Aplysia californica]|uniref:Formin-like protein 5 n=1 Tax=Aplysia californica TaxID=6500 RepID=A0ABM1AA12_APLCA|nr:formin-like protein 5 [Aplysia californica]